MKLDDAARARARLASRVVTTLRPGQKGTARHLTRFGSHLLCVRHRHDELTGTRLVTVELVISERCAGPFTKNVREVVAIAVRKGESRLIGRLRRAGALWDAETRQWKMRLGEALALGLRRRVRPLRSPQLSPSALPPHNGSTSRNPSTPCI